MRERSKGLTQGRLKICKVVAVIVRNNRSSSYC